MNRFGGHLLRTTGCEKVSLPGDFHQRDIRPNPERIRPNTRDPGSISVTRKASSVTNRPGRTDNMAWRRAKAQAVKDSNGVCQLCGEQLDPSARKNTPWATEIDHIMPLAAGGAPYARENLRALHQWCHARRGKGKPPPRVPAAEPAVWVAPDPWVSCPTCPNSCSYPRPASRCW